MSLSSEMAVHAVYVFSDREGAEARMTLSKLYG